MACVFLNGRFVERGDALLSAFDAGLQHGVGLFETMLGVTSPECRVLHLREHVDRLQRSARELGLSEYLHAPPLEEAVLRTLGRAHADDPSRERFRIRLTITGGDLNLLDAARGGGAPEQAPTLLIAATPAPDYPQAMFERGVGVVIGDLRLNPLDPHAGHKTLNYWPRLRELQHAAAKRAGEAVLLQVTNHLAGGCVSNIFLARGGELLTPIARGEEGFAEGAGGSGGGSGSGSGSGSGKGSYLASPVLPGITREWVLEWARGSGVSVRRKMLSVEEMLGADEVFLTNSSWGALPVVKVESEAIGDGVVGPLSQRIMEAWRKELA